MTDLLEVQDLEVDFQTPVGLMRAVDGVSLRVRPGSTVALVGESGSGKSVTAQAILGILPRNARLGGGRILFADRGPENGGAAPTVVDLAALDPESSEFRNIRGGRISMIFQEPMTSLSALHTVGDQAREALLLHSTMGAREGREVTVEMLRMVGFPDPDRAFDTYPFELSGGLRQRAMIAMALVCRPALLIADEPTTALDVTIQAQILLLMAGLQKEFHMGMILITHDLGIVARVADRVNVMYAGEIVETGTAVQIFDNPTHPYTQGLLDCIPIPGKTQRGARLGSIPGIVPSMIGDMTGCTFRHRCHYATDACAGEVDMQDGFSPGHRYQCLLSPEQCAENAKREVVA